VAVDPDDKRKKRSLARMHKCGSVRLYVALNRRRPWLPLHPDEWGGQIDDGDQWRTAFALTCRPN